MSLRWIAAACALLAASLLATPPPAWASDGVIELNATLMAAGIPSIGDAPGAPLTIGQPGSYVLTSDLFVTGANETVVEITSGHVTLDLNGFAVRCAYVFTPCKGTGTGVGIHSVVVSNVTVRNGTVRDMADHGIAILGVGAVVQNVGAFANGGDGIHLGGSGRVESCTSIDNGGIGIQVSNGIVRSSVTRSNGTKGIYGGTARIVGNAVTSEVVGIDCGSCTIQDNDVSLSGTGIVGGGSVIRGNVVADGTGDGITGLGADVIDNTIQGNTGFGIKTSAAYGRNVLQGNNAGAEVQSSSPGPQLGSNFCGTDTVCP